MISRGMFPWRVVSGPVSVIWRGQHPCYSTTTGSQDTSAAERIEPVSLSFNSYETTTATTTAAPIIIMHGKVSPVLTTNSNWSYDTFNWLQVSSARRRTGEASVRRCTRRVRQVAKWSQSMPGIMAKVHIRQIIATKIWPKTLPNSTDSTISRKP